MLMNLFKADVSSCHFQYNCNEQTSVNWLLYIHLYLYVAQWLDQSLAVDEAKNKHWVRAMDMNVILPSYAHLRHMLIVFIISQIVH